MHIIEHMKTCLHAAAAAALILTASCKMENPLLTESPLPYGAPQFDKIRTEHYLPAFKEGIAEAKADIDAITSNPDAPTFANTIEALEFAGEKLGDVSSIFYNLLEAESSPEMQAVAEQISPMMTEYSMYVSLNDKLFQRIKDLWNRRDSLGLEPDQYKLLDDTYKSFARNGANLSPEENGQQGWTFDLSYPSYSAFIKFSARPELRKQIYLAYNSIAYGGEFDNSEICLQLADLRLKTARLLGYETYADYMVEDRMAGSVENVDNLLDALLEPSLPAARKEVARIYDYARENGYTESELQPWDFSYWSEKYKAANYSLSDEQLKPYFRLEDCIDAVFGLATRLYGLQFNLRTDIPGYNKDVKVYDVCDADGRHLALFYADFFPRASKRSGAWMTSFRGQSIKDGVERRPLVSIVTNFSKPTENAPSLLTHYELTTFLHEFGHSLQGMMAEGRYPSQTGTNVAWDFVELPSQIMENWAYEPEYLKPFAKHYETGEEIPDELIEKISESKNYNVAYSQVRQLQFGLLDMAWHDTATPLEGNVRDIELNATRDVQVLPTAEGTCMSPSFSHIFAGGYSAGYYSYKWAEVLAADAWSLFKEKGIFNTEVATSFRENVLSKGSTEPEAVLYRNFRGHDPQPEALLRAQGIE